MKKQLNEVFRLQQLAGLKPVNEYFFFDKDGESGEETPEEAPSEKPKDTPTDYCYGYFDGMDYMADGSDRRRNIDVADLEAKGYKKLEFNTYEELINSPFAKKNQGQIDWAFMHPNKEQGKKFFDAYSSKYGGPLVVYTQDSILEKNEE